MSRLHLTALEPSQILYKAGVNKRRGKKTISLLTQTHAPPAKQTDHTPLPQGSVGNHFPSSTTYLRSSSHVVSLLKDLWLAKQPWNECDWLFKYKVGLKFWRKQTENNGYWSDQSMKSVGKQLWNETSVTQPEMHFARWLWSRLRTRRAVIPLAISRWHSNHAMLGLFQGPHNKAT